MLDVAPPCGEFFLDPELKDDRPLIMIAGSIGITPLMSLLLAGLLSAMRSYFYFGSNGIGARKGFIDAWLLETVIGDRDADYPYYSGPTLFLLLSKYVHYEEQHFEFFGPKEELMIFAEG